MHKQTTALHTQFFGALEKMGFAVAHVEFNIACGFTCVEFLWVNRKLYPHDPSHAPKWRLKPGGGGGGGGYVGG